jgi:hypothetical protein
VTKLVLDSEKSRIRIRTFAEGLFSRLAHDVELVCGNVSGTAERTGSDSGSAQLEIPIGKIDLHGTLKDGRVDPNGLSPSDREDLIGKMRHDVFHTRGDASAVVRVEGTLDAGKARVRVVPPKGRTVERSVTLRLEPEGAGARVSGQLDLSLKEIGSDPVKGPMNAFRVKDSIELLFDLVFSEAG